MAHIMIPNSFRHRQPRVAAVIVFFRLVAMVSCLPAGLPATAAPVVANPLREALQPVPASAIFKMDGYYLWDPSVLRVGDTYHLFASRWADSPQKMAGWKKSHVIRATSKSLFGPYRFEEVVLHPSNHPWAKEGIHNPKILRVGNKFLLYHLGIPVWQTGFAWADSIEGPWIPVSTPVLATNNPAIITRADGTAYAVGKFKPARAGDGDWDAWMHAFQADSIHGPYQLLGGPGNRLPDGFELEDPTLWWANGRYHVVCTDWEAKVTGVHKAVVYYTSENGIDYKLGSPVPVWSQKDPVPITGAQPLAISGVERPQIFLDENNAVTALLAGIYPADRTKEPTFIMVRPVDGFLLAAPGPSHAGANTPGDRRRQVLEATWDDYQRHAATPSSKNAFWRASALFQLGKTAEARILANRGLDLLVPGNRENRWIYGGNTNFNAWPGIDCYIRHQADLDDATRARFRAIYTSGAFYQRLSTSNHKIMAAVTRYLATQVWGESAFHPHPFYSSAQAKPTHDRFVPEKGMRFEEKDPTGEKYIRAMIQEMVRSGPGEYASRPYGSANILPILSIAECANDEELRKRAAIAYEVALIQLAPAYLRGHLATFSPRSYPDVETQQPHGAAALLWPYFGGVEPASMVFEPALRVVVADYQAPAPLVAAGTRRTTPYTYRALLNRWALTHHVAPNHVVFSRSPKASTRQFHGQSYPSGVMWDEPDPGKGSHLWITHPAADEPGKMGIHTHGVTMHGQELQFEGTVLFTFHIPDDHPFPYVLGYVPGGHRATLSSRDRIFIHFGTVMIAISASSPIEWDPAGGILAPAAPPRPGDSEFRVRAKQAALAIETATPEEFPGADPATQLAAFQSSVIAKARLDLATVDKPTGTYRDRHGHTLQCVFDGPDTIDGQTVDYQRWPVLESPWSRQAGPDGPLEFTDGKESIIYDFSRWTKTRKP